MSVQDCRVPVKPLRNVNVTINVIGDLDMMIVILHTRQDMSASGMQLSADTGS